MHKKISIIVPCYKVEKYVRRCLESLLNQTVSNLEIICVNDGSPDNCLAILEEYKKQYGDRIVIIDKKNEGVWKARVDGIKLASGEYIGFVDADDFVEPQFVEKLYQSIIENNADISICGFERVDMETGKVYSQEMCNTKKVAVDLEKRPDELLCINTALWNKLYKADILKKMLNISKPPRVLEDMMFLMLICLKASKVSYVPEVLKHYMVRENSAINTQGKQDINITYSAMKDIREIYAVYKKEWLELVDVMAFLHLGVSLMFRISYDPNSNLEMILDENKKYLNNIFPNWKKTEYLTLRYMVHNGFENLKLWIVYKFYKYNMFGLFLKIYKFVIDTLKIDIKW